MITRFKGDNYPITATLKVNHIVKDITGATVTFSYMEKTTLKSIIGTITDAPNGIVKFYPTAEDFQVVDNFSFNIKRAQDGYIYTHIKDTLSIENDI